MPRHLTMTLERVDLPCAACGGKEGGVYCYYLEEGTAQTNTPNLCLTCFTAANTTRTVTLEEAPAQKGARPPSKRYRRIIQRHEREVAERIGGTTQKASGAIPGYKSDVRKRGELRGELKETGNKSFTLKRETLDKIRGECVGTEHPFLGIRFVNPITKRTEDEWVCVPFETWLDMVSRQSKSSAGE